MDFPTEITRYFFPLFSLLYMNHVLISRNFYCAFLGKQEMVAKNAQDLSEKPETVLQKQLVVDEGEEIMVPKTETETETMVIENNQHPLLPDQPDLPPTTEDLKALVKMLPAP